MSYIELICSADWFLFWHSNPIESHYYDSRKTFLATKKWIWIGNEKAIPFCNESNLLKSVKTHQKTLLEWLAEKFVIKFAKSCRFIPTLFIADHCNVLYFYWPRPFGSNDATFTGARTNFQQTISLKLFFGPIKKNCCFFALNPPPPIDLPPPFPNYHFILIAII